MNCLEFRRRLMIDPLQPDAEAAAHEATCDACARHAREVRAQELELRALINGIKAPEGLAERVQLAVRDDTRSRRIQHWWYGMAASVLLAVGVSLFTLWSTYTERAGLALAQSVVQHIEDEASHLHEAHPVSRGRVAYVFRRFGAELVGDIGPVNFAAECLMRQRNGIHLVLPGTLGAITVFLMPGEMTDHPVAVESARFAGTIIPTEWGSIAVVGEHGETIDGIGENLAAMVEWPAQGVAGSGVAVGRLVGRGALAAAQQQDG
jgi:hypothetical protein